MSFDNQQIRFGTIFFMDTVNLLRCAIILMYLSIFNKFVFDRLMFGKDLRIRRRSKIQIPIQLPIGRDVATKE